MANIKVPDAGLLKLLDYLSTNLFGTLKVRLFKNNLTVVAGTVLADLTEANYSGYAAQTAAGWSAAAIVSGAGSTTGTPLTFATANPTTITNNIYGAYITDAGNTILYWAQNDANAPIPMAVPGQIYVYTPNFADTSI